MSLERRRLTLALLLSLLIHTLLLSLTFSGQGLGFPVFGFPWRDRRIEAPDLRVALVPAQPPAAEPAVAPVAEPSQHAWVERPVARKPAVMPSVSLAPTPGRTAEAIGPEASPRAEADSSLNAATGAPSAKTLSRTDRPGGTAPPPLPTPPVIAVEQSDEATWALPAATPAMPTPAIPAAPSASSSETAMPPLRDAGNAAQASLEQEAREGAAEPAGLDRGKQEAQRQAAQEGAARQEAARQEPARLEAERQVAAKQEAALQEAARQAAAQREAAQEEAAQREAARQEAAQRDAAQQDAAQRDAAQQEAAWQELARQEAAHREAARQELARQEAARQEEARVALAQEAAERREAARRAMGRQLDEEAARRETASAARRLAPSSSSARRYRLFGRADPNAELILYAEAWERKIQLNMTFDMVREAAKLPHTDPMVTVAIRSDGSVESVTFAVSSGAPAIDGAIRRIVHSQEHYQPFPPGLAREFDVIEIRRTWSFDMAIRLH